MTRRPIISSSRRVPRYDVYDALFTTSDHLSVLRDRCHTQSDRLSGLSLEIIIRDDQLFMVRTDRCMRSPWLSKTTNAQCSSTRCLSKSSRPFTSLPDHLVTATNTCLGPAASPLHDVA